MSASPLSAVTCLRCALLAFMLVLLSGSGASAGSIIRRTGEVVGDEVRNLAAVGLHNRYSVRGWTRTQTDDQAAEGEEEVVVPGRVAVASILPGREVEVSTWNVSHTGGVEDADAEAGGFSAASIAITAIHPAHVFTAARVWSTNALRLTAWDIHTDGDIDRRGSANAGAVTGVSVAPVDEVPNATSCRIVTFTTDANGQGKLIVWKYTYETGAFAQQSSASVGIATQPAVINVAPGRIVIAYQAVGVLLMQAWDIPQSGAPQPLDSVVRSPGGEQVAMTLAGRNRVVTVHSPSAGSIRLQAWNLALDTGRLKLAHTRDVAGQDAATIAPAGAGTKVVTAARNANGRLLLSAWRVVDGIEPLGAISGGVADRIRIVPVWTDRFATALRQDDGKLKVIAWNDLSVGLIHGTWLPPSAPPAPPPGRPPTARGQAAARSAHQEDEAGLRREAGRPPAATASAPAAVAAAREGAREPSPAARLNVAFSDMGAEDPMVAAGRSFVIVSDTTSLRFLDRQGQMLTMPDGSPASFGTRDFFAALTSYTPANPHRNDIHLYQAYTPYTLKACQVLVAPVTGPCVREFYDTRVGYSDRHRRFFVVAAVRPSDLGTSLFYSTRPRYYHEPLAARWVAFALSRSENPLDGFDLWMTVESSLRDWPFGEFSGNAFLISHRSKGDSARNSARAAAFSIDDMLAGRADLRNWRIYDDELDGDALAPVTTPAGDTGDTSLYVRVRGGGIVYFDQPANDWSQRPAIRKAAFQRMDLSGLGIAATLRNGALYVAGVYRVRGRIADSAPHQWGVRVVRLELARNAAGRYDDLAADSALVSETLIDGGTPDDPAGTAFSYEASSVAVNASGEWLVAFGRVQTQGAPLQPQEVRYALWRGGRGLLASRLLRAGDAPYLATAEGESVPTMVGYVNDESYCPTNGARCVCGKNTGCSKQKIDYAHVVPDPADGRSFWIAHAVPQFNADRAMQGFRLVLGHVPVGP